MSQMLNGELVPVGGGDTIPLIREVLTIGRRESCDICLRFPDISGVHCQLFFHNGYWLVRDLNSTNGVKVNGARVQEKLLHPNDELSIGRKRRFTIHYELPADRRQALDEQPDEDILSQSLLQRAGLEKPGKDKDRRPGRPAPSEPADFTVRRFKLSEDEEDE
jgi:pSer/pThr/pTyr-binding forkhead associated (FHA) protein